MLLKTDSSPASESWILFQSGIAQCLVYPDWSKVAGGPNQSYIRDGGSHNCPIAGQRPLPSQGSEISSLPFSTRHPGALEPGRQASTMSGGLHGIHWACRIFHPVFSLGKM